MRPQITGKASSVGSVGTLSNSRRMSMAEQLCILLFFLRDKSGRTPLHLAAIVGDESICDILLGAKDPINTAILIKDAEERLPLWYAGEGNKLGIFKRLRHETLKHMSLLEICSETDKKGATLVEYCTAHGLAQSELLDLVKFSQFPDLINIRPDLYATVDQSWQNQLSVISGKSLSPWAVNDVAGEIL
ncbi:hypothetical protein AK830_g9242 [Neonectria ditissima]|uniref:Uncharacterized protein n=1 Tax=Neonectria ditissima TaxID=78410 RepID=A0A0P7B9I7_9HYPO|nr:hypothetical protein AK830_g9242 [Neonectria ditissima]